jgi:hypothetical protein
MGGMSLRNAFVIGRWCSCVESASMISSLSLFSPRFRIVFVDGAFGSTGEVRQNSLPPYPYTHARSVCRVSNQSVLCSSWTTPTSIGASDNRTP